MSVYLVLPGITVNCELQLYCVRYDSSCCMWLFLTSAYLGSNLCSFHMPASAITNVMSKIVK